MKSYDDPPATNKGKECRTAEDKLRLIYSEIKAIDQRQHRNLIKLIDFGDDGIVKRPSGKERKVYYLVYELAEGGDLQNCIKNNNPLSISIARYYFQQLVSVVEYLHTNGICHRDIKPQNMLLDEKYNLKLADFGFATPTDQKDVVQPLCGTGGYKAPELISCYPSTGQKVDIFAMGITLFQLLLIKYPFNTEEVCRNFVKNKPAFWAPIRMNHPGRITNELIELLNKMLSPFPAERPTSSQLKEFKWFKEQAASPKEVYQEISKLTHREPEVQAIAQEALKSQTTVPSASVGKRIEGVTLELIRAKENIKQYQVFIRLFYNNLLK